MKKFNAMFSSLIDSLADRAPWFDRAIFYGTAIFLVLFVLGVTPWPLRFLAVGWALFWTIGSVLDLADLAVEAVERRRKGRS